MLIVERAVLISELKAKWLDGLIVGFVMGAWTTSLLWMVGRVL